MLHPLSAALLAMVVSAPALAQKRLAVVDLATPPTMTGLGNQVAQTVLKTAQEQGYSVTAPDELRSALGESLYNQLVLCVGKPVCLESKLAALKVDRVVA